MENISEEERDAVNELKNKLKSDIENEFYEDENLFYRFLKAWNFNISNAEKKLREHLEWRKEYDVKHISEVKNPEVLEKYVPIIKLGYDKEGNVVRFLPSGNIDWIGVNDSCKFESFLRYFIQKYEEDLKDLKEQSKKLGKTVDKVFYIHDLGNLSFAQATNKKVIYNFIYFLNTCQNHYPEMLKAIVVYNASSIFSLLFSILKKFLPASVLKKTLIYSDDSYKEDLLKSIDAEVLPEFLGGTRTDPDGNPLCLTFINYGGPVPEKYFIHRSKKSLAGEPDVEKITLTRASFHEVVLEVKEPDSYLEWEFEIQSRDTGFGLFYQDEEENKIELVPMQRINTDEYSESGIYKCENVGTYIAVFDNTYSFIRSKVVFYKIRVITSKEAALDLTE